MEPNQRLGLLCVMVCTFLVAMDQTVTSTITPVIVKEMGDSALYAWVLTSYNLGNAIIMPIAGRLAELYSPRRVHLASVLVFMLGSVLCGVAPNLPCLIAARGLQGLGGGAVIVVGGTLLCLLLPPRQRATYMGYFGAVIALAGLLGPLVGGVVADYVSWRAVFFLNLGPGALAVFLLGWRLTEVPPEGRGHFDGAGAVLLLVWSIPLLLAFSWGGTEISWTSPAMGGLGLLTLVGLGLFLKVEGARAHPLVDLRLLTNRVVFGNSLALWLTAGTFTGVLLFLPLYFIQVRGLSATQAGMCLIPTTLGAVFAGVSAGHVVARMGKCRPPLVLGSVLTGATLGVAALHFGPATPLLALIGGLFVMGLGFGMLLPIYELAVQNAVPRERLGTALSAATFCQELGATMVPALMGAWVAASPSVTVGLQRILGLGSALLLVNLVAVLVTPDLPLEDGRSPEEGE